MTRTGLAVIVTLLVSASFASAMSVSYNTPFGPTATPAVPFGVTLPQFNPALGTLLSVTLQLDANTFAGSIDWDNEAAIPTDVTLGIGAEVTATAPSALAVIAVPLQLGSALGVAADNDGAADFIGTDSFSVSGGSGSDSDSNTLSSGFASYIGTGTFSTTISSLVQNFLSTTGGFGPIQQTPGSVDGMVTVTYNYVPEPATMSLLAVGGLAVLKRRRRKIA